jgi:hypothetical protein
VASSQSDGMPTPVDEFRHHSTAHQFLAEIADLPSLKQPLDPSRDFRCKSRVLPGWNANCPAVQPARDLWDHTASDASNRWGERRSCRVTMARRVPVRGTVTPGP